jgi:uncharacterized membrane protein
MEKGSWMARESLRLVVLVLPFIFLFVFWDQLPAGRPWWEDVRRIAPSPISRFALTALALLNLVLYGLFQLWYSYRPQPAPGKPNSWQILQLFCHQLLAFTFFLVSFRALELKLPPSLVLQYGIITLLLVLGSFLDTIPRNSVFGFRLSWTLKSDYIWLRTHRFAAQVWVYTSFFMLLHRGWQTSDWVFPLYVGLLVLLPIIFSYLTYQRHLKPATPPKK